MAKPSKPQKPTPDFVREVPLKAVILIALTLPLLGAAWFARDYAGSIVGPLAIASNGTNVAIIAPGRLYHLDGNGKLLSTDETSIAEDAVDAGLTYIGDTLLASPGANDNALLSCDEKACARFSKDNWAPRGAVQATFDGALWWFSEAHADRLQRYDTAGKRIDMPLSDLHYPGSIARIGEEIFVADTADNRITRHLLHKRGIDEAVGFATWSDGRHIDPIRQPRRFVAYSDGSFDAIFSNDKRTRGQLVHITPEGATTSLDVAGLVNPVDIALLGDTLLLLDEDRMNVVTRKPDGSTGEFGSEEFRAGLSAEAKTRDTLRIASPVLFALGVLSAAVGMTWLLARVTRQRFEPALDVKPDENGVLWIPAECDLAPKRIPRLLIIATPLALIPAAAWWYAQGRGLSYMLLWVVLCYAVAVTPALLAAFRARLPKAERIGVRDRQLIVTHPERGLYEYPLPKVEWNESVLRPDEGIEVPLMRGAVALYHPATVEELLIPRLNLMKKIEV